MSRSLPHLAAPAVRWTALAAVLAACSAAPERRAGGSLVAEDPSGEGHPAAATQSAAPEASAVDAGAPVSTPAPACTARERLAGELTLTIESGGASRLVRVHLPPSYEAARATPVVLDFHGFTSNGTQQSAYGGMNAKADASGFIAVHPEGVGLPQSWNGGTCCGQAMAVGTADVTFVDDILDELEKRLCVDVKRVFATGMSNGAFLAHRLACELSHRIAAVAPVAGVIGVPTCTPARPVPVLEFHGTFDPLVPYLGDPALGFPSVAATIAGWSARNGCQGEPVPTLSAGNVRCTTHDRCQGGADVTLCTVEGGGHTWPGAPIDIPAFGPTSRAVSATDVMWEFFRKHPMP